MTYIQSLEIVAHWSAICTAGVAVIAYGRYQYERSQKRSRLEKHLKSEKAKGKDKGQRTIVHLVANLGMTETEVVDAAFRSKHIKRVVDVDKDGYAKGLLLEYDVTSN